MNIITHCLGTFLPKDKGSYANLEKLVPKEVEFSEYVW